MWVLEALVIMWKNSGNPNSTYEYTSMGSFELHYVYNTSLKQNTCLLVLMKVIIFGDSIGQWSPILVPVDLTSFS